MKLDLTQMLEKIEAGRWNLEDIEWSKPGYELITPEQYAQLRDFMSDLVWIEHVGAKGFAALARKAPDPQLAEIYRHFEREEEQHARAELALMRRWGMLGANEIPVANTNIRMTIQWMDKHIDKVDFTALTCLIASLEVSLDGALVKLLLDQVEDPVCHDVFRLINRDEARHLTMDFHVMELMGMGPQTLNTLRLAAGAVRPEILLGVLTYVPLMSRMRNNVVKIGMDAERMYSAIRRFEEVGSRSAATRRLRAYHIVRGHTRMMVDDTHPYHLFADAMVKLTGAIPTRAFGPLPAWTRPLAEPTPGARPVRHQQAAA